MPGIVIRNGTIVTALDQYVADIYCEDGLIKAIGPALDVPAGSEVVDASGQYVFPGGIDAHTHMELPFMGTVSADETIHQGLELALDTLLWERVQIRQAYLWTDARFDGDRVFGDNQLAGIPEHFYRAEFFYRWPQGYYAGPTLQWAPSDTPIDHANTLFADGYAVVGLRAGFRPAHGLAWFVDARNLAGTTYAASTGVIADARGRDAAQFLPGDGLAVYGGIEWRF